MTIIKLFQFVTFFLRAYSTAQQPIIKQARTKMETNIQTNKDKNLDNIDNNKNSSISTIAPATYAVRKNEHTRIHNDYN
jgi:hypothetical protein